VARGRDLSEYDYSMLDSRRTLGRKPDECRLFMVFDGRFKYVHAPGFRPMLWDLATDPNEYRDLGDDPAYAAERERLSAALADWGLRMSQRTTISEAQILKGRGRSQRKGILIGVWDETDIPQDLWSAYRGEG
jgi:arylsulfatase A-like enzyme